MFLNIRSDDVGMSHKLDALTTTKFTGALKARNVVLTTYRELIAKQGLKAMRRPAG